MSFRRKKNNSKTPRKKLRQLLCCMPTIKKKKAETFAVALDPEGRMRMERVKASYQASFPCSVMNAQYFYKNNDSRWDDYGMMKDSRYQWSLYITFMHKHFLKLDTTHKASMMFVLSRFMSRAVLLENLRKDDRLARYYVGGYKSLLSKEELGYTPRNSYSDTHGKAAHRYAASKKQVLTS